MNCFGNYYSTELTLSWCFIVIGTSYSSLHAVRYAMRTVKKDRLTQYHTRRNFKKSQEPRGTILKKKKNIFVVQRHVASHLHYDFRLYINGVLKSWAIPKGIPTRSGIKRLAVMTEDHPVEYASFEGIIPEGSYGAGTVEIWDRGIYQNLKKTTTGRTKSIQQCLKDGILEFELHGNRFTGTYILVRMHGTQQKNWLLMKKHPNTNSI